MADPTVSGRVRALVEPPLGAAGLEVVDVERVATRVRITVDRPGGVDLEALTEATRTMSRLLDDRGLLGERDTLEVSSPGVERPLRTPDHFRRFVGATVAVRTRPGVEGARRLEGTLEAADDEGVVVAGRRLSHSDIERARTVFRWPAEGAKGRPPKVAAR